MKKLLIQNLLITLFLLIQLSNCLAQSQSINKDSVLNAKFNARAINWKGDTLICLTKEQAHMASFQLKKIPYYRNQLTLKDTIILKLKENINFKDSIIILNKEYQSKVEKEYSLCNDIRTQQEEIIKEQNKYGKYKSIGLVILFICFLIK